MSHFRDVDPRDLRLPPSRRQGADPAKLARQISLFGKSGNGMPPLWVYEGLDGILMLYNGVNPGLANCEAFPRYLDSGRGDWQASKNVCWRTQDRRFAAMMPDPKREALSVLSEICELSPDIRLGQLFAHLGFLGDVHLGRGLGVIDDEELITILNRHREELLLRLEKSST